MSRTEDIFQAMIDGSSSSEIEQPDSRVETLLLRLLDKMNGETDSSETVQPDSRVEALLLQLIDKTNGSSGGGSSGGSDYTIPDDGKTHFLVYIDPETPRNLRDVTLRWEQSVNNGVLVDWNDGSSPESFSDEGYEEDHTHTYTQPGRYDISLEVTSGTMKLKHANGYSVYGARTNSTRYKAIRFQKAVFGTGISPEASALYSAFALTSVKFPSATMIGSNAFNSCFGLTKVIIPSTVTSIGAQAFGSCSGIYEYHIQATTPPVLSDANAFSAIQPTSKIYVPKSTNHTVLDDYKTTTNWVNLADYIEEEP